MKNITRKLLAISCIIATMIATLTSVSSASASVTEGGFDVSKMTNRTVSGDFNGDGIDDTAGIYYYGNGETRIFTWLSNGKDFTLNWNWWYTKSGFNADKMTGRVVSGDFNNDGLDDIAAFYDYGKGECRLFVWQSNGKSFDLKWNKWYMPNGFTASNITNRVVAGDFNGDGNDDICAFYDYGKGECRAFVWHSWGDNFTLNWNYWYMKNGFFANKITNRVVAGKFSDDNRDDICAFYDYGKGECRAFVYETLNGKFNLSWNYWYTKSGFTASKINNRIVVGKFSDDDREDICAFYDYGKGECRAFVYNNMNGKFSLSWNYWYMKSGFTASNINNRVVAGDFNNDNRTDICAFYDYGKGLARAFVWHSWGGNMTLNWDYWSSNPPSYNNGAGPNQYGLKWTKGMSPEEARQIAVEYATSFGFVIDESYVPFDENGDYASGWVDPIQCEYNNNKMYWINDFGILGDRKPAYGYSYETTKRLIINMINFTVYDILGCDEEDIYDMKHAKELGLSYAYCNIYIEKCNNGHYNVYMCT